MVAPAPPTPEVPAAADELAPPPPVALTVAKQVPSGTVPAGRAPAVFFVTAALLGAGSASARSTPTPTGPSIEGSAMARTAISCRITRDRRPARGERRLRPFTESTSAVGHTS